MKVFKYLTIILISMVLGVALVFGGVAYFAVSQFKKPGSMGTLSTVVNKVVPVKWDDEVKNLAVSAYIKELASVLGNLSDTEIKRFEKLVGTKVLSNTLKEMTGISSEIIEESKVGKLGKTMADNMTIQLAKDKMGIKLSDIPLFKDTVFLNTPLSSAFESIDEYHLDRVINIVYEEDATEDKPASKPVVQKLGKIKIKDLSAQLDEVVKDSTLGELININASSERILQYLKDTKVKDLNPKISSMQLKDVILINEESHVFLRKLQNLTIAQLSDNTVTTPIIDSIKIGEIVKITEDSEQILKSLQDTPIGEMDTKIANLTVEEVFESSDAGALALIDPTIKLTDVPKQLTENMPKTSLYALSKAGVFDITEPTKLNGRIRAYNSTMQDAVSAYSDAVSGSGMVTNKRKIVYIYDNAAQFATEQLDASHILSQTSNPLFDIKTYDISSATKDTDGFYMVPASEIANLMGDASKAHGVELALQSSVNLKVAPSVAGETISYSYSFSVSSYYESVVYTDPDFSDYSSIASNTHAQIRIGSGVSIVNAIGGYIYYMGPSGSLFVDSNSDDTFDSYVDETITPIPAITRKMIKKTATEDNPNPVAEPNLRIDFIIK